MNRPPTTPRSESARAAGEPPAKLDSPARLGPPAELSWISVLLGMGLSAVMGAANVYLGLRAGMTVSASIPAAVIAMGLLQGVLRRRSLLESNIVQTAASAGESLAAGIIFTMPALILTGIWPTFDFWTTTLVAATGGALGVLLMIPMRQVFVVGSPELHFPEGVACAEVLRAGGGVGRDGLPQLPDEATTGAAESAQPAVAGDTVAGDAASASEAPKPAAAASTGAAVVVGGLLLGGVVKLAGALVHVIHEQLEWGTLRFSRAFYVGIDVSPALVAVGVIVGLPIAVQIFLGGALGWLVVIPLLGAPAEGGDAREVAYTLWSTQVRYLGVGTMAVGGIASIWRVRRGLVAAVRDLWGQLRGGRDAVVAPVHVRNLPGGVVLALTALTVLSIAALYYHLLHGAVGITLVTLAAMLVMSFFFTAVASYLVGLVGNSNSPVSGMTITAVLFTGGMIYLFGYRGPDAMLATLGVAGIVCCAACTSGDVCNDLKTGLLVGASPRSQQTVQFLGVLVGSLVMAPVMTVLHQGSLNAGTGGIGGQALPAPQASLFAALVDGFFGNGALPWNLVAIGAALGVALLIGDRLLQAQGAPLRLHVMPVAVGIYLPLALSAPILLGGLVAAAIGRIDSRPVVLRRGVLSASGMIAGESLVGVAIGVLAYLELHGPDWGARFLGARGVETATAVALAAICLWIVRAALARRSSLAKR